MYDLELDFAAAVVRNLSQGKELKGMPLSGDLVNIVAAGGILSLLRSPAQA